VDPLAEVALVVLRDGRDVELLAMTVDHLAQADLPHRVGGDGFVEIHRTGSWSVSDP
jgi:hypothetical protein